MIASLFAALLLLSLLFALLVWLKRPIYRLDNRNLEKLFELVLDDRASENDWNVFIELPIRYQPNFDELRLRCRELTELHGRYRDGRFYLSDAGKTLLRTELDELKGQAA